MEGMGTVFQIEKSFWHLEPKAGVEQNPLGYFCAPNGATPDYVSAESIYDFIAYAFISCWDALCPEYFTMWNMVEEDDVQWMRHNFLTVLESLVLGLYEGNIEPDTNDFDWGSWGQILTIGSADDGDEEEVMYTWAPYRVCSDDNTLSLVLNLADMQGGSPPGDEEVIWLDLNALKDRAAVKAAFDEAYKVNKLGLAQFKAEFGPRNDRWEAVLAAQPVEE